MPLIDVIYNDLRYNDINPFIGGGWPDGHRRGPRKGLSFF